MRLGIVIPWFGRELKGGAEQQAWQIAARLAARGHQVEVITTCCRSHQDDWSTNHLPAGVTSEPEGFDVRRFPVDPRERHAFDRVCRQLLETPLEALKPGVSPVSAAYAEIFSHELIRSAALLEFLERQQERFESILFLPYLYGPVLSGIAIVRERAALQPCLHDEPYAYLPNVAAAFAAAGSLLFNSEGEQELALRLFGPGIWHKSRLIGEGVEVEVESTRTNGRRTAASPPYVLYLGRKDPGKNVPLLLRAFRLYRASRPNSNLRLRLAGIGSADLLESDGDTVEDLGLVSEEVKTELLAGCSALFQPSQNESFSRVLMEAWMHGKPVAAHRSCLATAVAVERARGGWVAGSEGEWAETFARVERATAAERAAMGERGRTYAAQLANWEAVLDRYEQALDPPRISAAALPPATPQSIDQFVPNCSYGDAISNSTIWIRDQLRKLGYRSTIYARYIDPRVAHECEVFSPAALATSDAVLYHHSVGSEVTEHVVRFDGPKALIYHNITPAEFFAPYWPDFAAVVQRGRDDLPSLASSFDNSYGVSRFNADELRACGFREPGVFPLVVDPRKWSLSPDPIVMDRMQDGRTNLLFVGRISPNKKQDDLVRAFDHYLELDPDARLVVVGKAEPDDPYARHVHELIRTLGLQDAILTVGSVSDAELGAYYRTASLFWSMSEHEGFCVPLVEAMWFDIPILAYKSSAIPETIGEGGLLFTSKDDLAELAAAAHLLVHDRTLRQAAIAGQRARRERYLPEQALSILRDIAADLLPSGAAHNDIAPTAARGGSSRVSPLLQTSARS